MIRLPRRRRSLSVPTGIAVRIEQSRVFRMIPGLEQCEIQRYGSVHRNTFVNSPVLLDELMQLRAVPNVFLAGQITGVEGYVESCASGFVCVVMLAQSLAGAGLAPPPETTALGGIRTHVMRAQPNFQPSNITWACMPPHPERMKKRAGQLFRNAPDGTIRRTAS